MQIVRRQNQRCPPDDPAEPPECEADPIADVPWLAIALVSGLALIIPVLPVPCAPNPPRNPPIDSPCAIAWKGGACGAVMEWGTELSRGACIAESVEPGPRSVGGAPATRVSDVGADWDWMKDLGASAPLEKDAACAGSCSTELMFGGEARASLSIMPWRSTGAWAPAVIAPVAPRVARIAVDGIAAS
jgi:hypothetical protein